MLVSSREVFTMRGSLALAVAALSPWLAACGGPLPRGPSSSTPTTAPAPSALAAGTALSVGSGENHQAMGGARPVVAARSEYADAADPVCVGNSRILAFTVLNVQAGETTGGRVVFCGLGSLRREIVAHELAHTVGLQHSPNPREVMAAFAQPNGYRDFGVLEILSMGLLFERRGGNRFPANDRDLPAPGTGPVTIVGPR